MPTVGASAQPARSHDSAIPGLALVQELTGSTDPTFDLPPIPIPGFDAVEALTKFATGALNRANPIVDPGKRALRVVGGKLVSKSQYLAKASAAREKLVSGAVTAALVDLSLFTGLVKEIKARRAGECRAIGE